MNHDTIRDYLIRAEMTDGQAEALSRVFAEMATKSDLQTLEVRMQSEFAAVRGEARTDLATMRADLTWKMIAIVGFFATASTLFNLIMV